LREVARRTGKRKAFERRHVFQDPHTPPVGAEHDVVLTRMDLDVVDRHGGEVATHRRPSRSGIDRDVEPDLVPEEQESGVVGVLGQRVDRRFR
jgi:hypothetical protein